MEVQPLGAPVHTISGSKLAADLDLGVLAAIGVGTASGEIGAGAAVQPVVAGTAFERIVARAALDLVVAGTPAQGVVAVPPADEVVTAPAVDKIGAPAAEDHIVARGAEEDVVAVITPSSSRTAVRRASSASLVANETLRVNPVSRDMPKLTKMRLQLVKLRVTVDDQDRAGRLQGDVEGVEAQRSLGGVPEIRDQAAVAARASTRNSAPLIAVPGFIVDDQHRACGLRRETVGVDAQQPLRAVAEVREHGAHAACRVHTEQRAASACPCFSVDDQDGAARLLGETSGSTPSGP